MRHSLLFPLFCGGLLLAGCASEPVATRRGTALGTDASSVAAAMVGKPYRYGGHDPKGFDCSGLVYYSYRQAGLTVPRTTPALRQRTQKVSAERLARGDLVFFNQEGKFSSHVGIYLGEGRFVHAPSRGKNVRVDRVSDAYWQKHFVDARRFF